MDVPTCDRFSRPAWGLGGRPQGTCGVRGLSAAHLDKPGLILPWQLSRVGPGLFLNSNPPDNPRLVASPSLSFPQLQVGDDVTCPAHLQRDEPRDVIWSSKQQMLMRSLLCARPCSTWWTTFTH